MSTAVEAGHRPYIDGQESGESHSPFLTDRESAELTALTTLGPLALIAFDTEPKLGTLPVAPETVQPDTPEVPDTLGGEFTQGELLTIMRQQHTVAAAAIMFAESRLN